MKLKAAMIACTADDLFALDEEGRVWRYVKATSTSPQGPLGNKSSGWAFWTKLTDHARDPADRQVATRKESS